MAQHRRDQNQPQSLNPQESVTHPAHLAPITEY